MTDEVTVLVVEDEDDIRGLVARSLSKEGFSVLEAPDGATALELARTYQPAVVLLDLMLPDMSGVQICEQLRADEKLSGAYIIMVTARTQEDDRISGFEVGADDYVTKPFSPKELVLRVKAAARRIERPSSDKISIKLQRLHIDGAAHKVWVENEELELTATEYKLLFHLATNTGKLCSRGELLQEVWGLPPSLNTRTVDTHIKRLRQKLLSAADYIETVRGAGYRFDVIDS